MRIPEGDLRIDIMTWKFPKGDETYLAIQDSRQ